MKVDDKYLQRLGVLPYDGSRLRRDGRTNPNFTGGNNWFAEGVNPIVTDLDAAPLIWGQRTLQGDGGALRRMNNRRQAMFETEMRTVQATGRTLRAEYTMELAEDLQAVHGIDAETMLAEVLAEEIHNEVIRDPRAVQADQELDALVEGGELERITVVEPVDRSVLTHMQRWMELIRSSS